jgi:hypothetical protein
MKIVVHKLALRIGMPNGFQMLVNPSVLIVDFNILNCLVSFPLDWDRQPLQTILGFNLVPISPVPVGILHIIQENENVDVIDDIEVSLPGDIVWLDYGYLHDRLSAGIPLLDSLSVEAYLYIRLYSVISDLEKYFS